MLTLRVRVLCQVQHGILKHANERAPSSLYGHVHYPSHDLWRLDAPLSPARRLTAESMLRSPGTFKFAVVRHPWTRFIRCRHHWAAPAAPLTEGMVACQRVPEQDFQKNLCRDVPPFPAPRDATAKSCPADATQ